MTRELENTLMTFTKEQLISLGARRDQNQEQAVCAVAADFRGSIGGGGCGDHFLTLCALERIGVDTE